MQLLRVREGEEQEDLEDDEGEEEEEKMATQECNTVHLYSATSSLLVVPISP